jgi:hypothetical protein
MAGKMTAQNRKMSIEEESTKRQKFEKKLYDHVMFSGTQFRSEALRVMSPARFRCAMPLCLMMA